MRPLSLALMVSLALLVGFAFPGDGDEAQACPPVGSSGFFVQDFGGYNSGFSGYGFQQPLFFQQQQHFVNPFFARQFAFQQHGFGFNRFNGFNRGFNRGFDNRFRSRSFRNRGFGANFFFGF